MYIMYFISGAVKRYINVYVFHWWCSEMKKYAFYKWWPVKIKSVFFKWCSMFFAGMRILQIFGRFQLLKFQIIISKVVGFHLKVTKTQFWTGSVGVIRLFIACFRVFHSKINLSLWWHSERKECVNTHFLTSHTTRVIWKVLSMAS